MAEAESSGSGSKQLSQDQIESLLSTKKSVDLKFSKHSNRAFDLPQFEIIAEAYQSGKKNFVLGNVKYKIISYTSRSGDWVYIGPVIGPGWSGAPCGCYERKHLMDLSE